MGGCKGGRENLFPKRFPSPQAVLSSNLQASACRPCRVTFPLEGVAQSAATRYCPPAEEGKHQEQGQALRGVQHLIPSQNKKSPDDRGQKKTPSRCELQGGLRTIFGSGLLSHMTLCSIIGDGELNFRVRNGVGCTLSSMATKEISAHLFESGRVTRRRALGHGLLCPFPALPAGVPCHIRTSAPKCGRTTEMLLSKILKQGWKVFRETRRTGY